MSLPGFKIPPLKLEPKRQVTLPFYGTVGAGLYSTDLAGRIPYPFRIIEVRMIFTEEAFNNIEHRWYVSNNRTIYTTGYPGDTNIFAGESPSTGFRGKAVDRVVPCNIEYPEGNLFIKLATYNAGNYAYHYNCSITIQEL